MQGPPTSSTHAVTVQSSTPSMQIPIQLIVPSHTMKAIDTHALVDSGADISCIDWDFVKKHWLSTTKLKTSIWAWNADNFYNKKGDILYTCILFLNIEGNCSKNHPLCHGLRTRQCHSRITLAHSC